MQRYRHYGTSSAPAAPVEEIHTEEEEEEEEEETGGANEEEVLHAEESGVTESEMKAAPMDNKTGRKTEDRGGGGGGGGPKFSMLTWFVVLALLGVWSSVAVLYFHVVDYDSVIARAQEFHKNFSQVLQGKLASYDTDGDGDFDMDDAKVLLGGTADRTNATSGLKEAKTLKEEGSPGENTETSGPDAAAPARGDADQQNNDPLKVTSPEASSEPASGSQDVESEIQAAVPLPPPVEDDFVPDDPDDSGHTYEEETNTIDSTGVLLKERQPEESIMESGRYQTSSKLTQEAEAEERPEPEPEPQTEAVRPTEDLQENDGRTEKQAEELKEKVKKKKTKLMNKLDKTIKAEIDAAEKLRKKGKLDEALKAFDSLVRQYPLSPRARYGKAQAEDDGAEKQRSNDLLQQAINTYGEVAELPDVTSDLLRAALKRRAERQQFLGRMRGSLATLQRLVQVFPEDVGLKNDLGVAHLLLGDNKGAKRVFEEILTVAPDNGFAKVHYGFILKAENKISESIPYLREGLESGEPGTDDGRFYFHLGDALQRVGDDSAYHWYELGHRRGHFASVWQRSLYNVDGLKAQPWWTPKETGYSDLVKMLERNWKTIRDEALAVMDRDSGHFVPEEENLREKGDWGQYTLWQQGRRVGTACQGVPKTCALIDRFPEATGCKRGQIKFSVMQPGTHVWPHTGPTNCRLRIHLGLVIPKPGCRIRCTNQTREWDEGKVLIFDDSFEHEVWQEADSYRLIFIVDVWHPELTQYQRQTLSPI